MHDPVVCRGGSAGGRQRLCSGVLQRSHAAGTSANSATAVPSHPNFMFTSLHRPEPTPSWSCGSSSPVTPLPCMQPHVKFRTAPQEHEFGWPYQLGHLPTADRPQDCMLASVRVQSGDIVILGSDGLWDNVFDREIAATAVGPSFLPPLPSLTLASHTVAPCGRYAHVNRGASGRAPQSLALTCARLRAIEHRRRGPLASLPRRARQHTPQLCLLLLLGPKRTLFFDTGTVRMRGSARGRSPGSASHAAACRLGLGHRDWPGGTSSCAAMLPPPPAPIHHSLMRTHSCSSCVQLKYQTASSAPNPSALVRELASTAYTRSQDRAAFTPYSYAASEWFDMVYNGGKKDDISVVAAFIE